MGADCIFCKIAAGEIPSARVIEDDSIIAFMDIGPIRPGHTLLIPKKHYDRVTDMPAAEAGRLLSVLPGLCSAVVRAAEADGVNVFQANGACAGQVVPHVHFHIIPRHEGDGADFTWRAGSYDEGEIETWRAKIAASLPG